MNYIEILKAIDNEFGQEDVYMWSTYILPNGHFLNPEKSCNNTFDISYEHCDFDYWVYDNFGDEGNIVLNKYCIKMNTTYPYLFLPEVRLTPAQVSAIKKIIYIKDFEYDFSGLDTISSDYAVFGMEEPLLILTRDSDMVFDLSIYSANDIIKKISQTYSIGKFIPESSTTDNRITYKDQDGTEIYDLYDLRNPGQVPVIIKDAEILDSSDPHRLKVFIDYPVVGDIFSLAGDAGRSYFDAEAGKKAFVRGTIYRHPEKGWRSVLVLWHPLTYIEECLALFQRRGSNVKTVEELIESRVADYDLEEVFKPLEGQIFYPSIDYRDDSQEGLHRAVYALMKDIDYIPVIIIK